jgi:[protein-PII] uridylyltransferase
MQKSWVRSSRFAFIVTGMATPATSPAQAPRRTASKTPPLLLAYGAARQQAMEQFSTDGRIEKLWRTLTRATDELLKKIAEKSGLTLIAVGGYGRRELFPYSDVDVLVILGDGERASDAERVAATLQQLWDMHIPVSHAVRTVAEAVEDAAHDHTVAASLMDARLVTGERKLYLALKKKLKQEVYGHEPRRFVEAKLSERDQRHTKWGDSRFVLEPNVKEGKGGLRDLQTLTWLARYCYGLQHAHDLVREDLLREDEWRHYTEAYNFFSSVRAHMHILRGRAEERLSFDLQIEIAARMKFPGRTAQAKAEQFMLRYFEFARHVGNLTRIFCSILEEENLRVPQWPFAADAAPQLPRYLVLTNGRLDFAPKVKLTVEPQQLIGLFAYAERYALDIHPRAHLQLTRALPKAAPKLPGNREANDLFREILLSRQHPDITLRRMNEMGVLAAIIPEFAGITGQMQYDGYHTYTVDEHTLVAVGNLFAVESGVWAKEMPLSTALARDIGDRGALYLGMLCHDIAKGQGGGHAEKGVAMVMEIAARIGMSKAQGKTAAWLVKNHLMLSDVAFKRDLEDPKTIADFVALVQSPERLRLLLLLTVADIKAVGPSIWNGWKGSLMRGLYYRTLAAMGVEELHPPEAASLQDEPAYAVWQSDHKAVGIRIAHDEFRAITEITCCLSNRPNLFRLLAGVMAWMGASIVSARIRVLPDGAAIATLGIQNTQEESFAEEEKRLQQLPSLIAAALKGGLDFEGELPKRRRISRVRKVAVERGVFIDNKISAQATVIEVNARDRLGLLYDILGALEACKLQVMTAHIATYGVKAVDVFYVKDAYGIKLDHPAKLAQTQRMLLEAIGND